MNVRAPLQTLLFAFGAGAGLLVAQTLLYQLLPYDSPRLGTVAVVVRLAFLIADVVLLAGTVRLVRAARSLRGFLYPAALLTTLATMSGVLDLTVHGASTDAHFIRGMARVIGAAEPAASLGAACLAGLALAALARTTRARGGVAGLTVVALTVLVGLGFRLVRIFDPGARAVWAAWLSWSLEVGRSAALALLAFGILRALAATPKGQSAKPDGPYRAAAAGAPMPAPPAPVPLSAEALPSLRSGATGLPLFALGFLFRAGASLVTTPLSLLLLGADARDASVLFLSGPLGDLGATALLLAGTAKLLPLRRAFRTTGPTAGAMAVLVMCCLVDIAAMALDVKALGRSTYRAYREASEVLTVHAPSAVALGGVALLFVASTLQRIGEGLADTGIEERARWLQGLVVTAGSALLATFLVIVSMPRRYEATYDAAGPVAVVTVLFTVSSFIAVLVLTFLLVSSVRRALVAQATSGA